MGIKIVVPVAEEPVTLAEAKEHLRVDGTALDVTIAMHIATAREEAEQILERSVAPQTLQLILDDFPAGPILLPRGPVTAVDWLKYDDEDGVEQTLSPAAYTLDDSLLDHWLLPAYDTDWPETREQANAMRVQYVAGWSRSSCPASIKSWLLLRIGTLHLAHEADAERPMIEHAFAQRLLDRYRVPGF